MGMFSQDCAGCGHPALGQLATTAGVNTWMSDVIAITPTGGIHAGEYDGYGHVDGAELAVGDSNTIWHRACWEVAGKPLDYRGPSVDSADQGWFFEDGAHDLPDPRTGGASASTSNGDADPVAAMTELLEKSESAAHGDSNDEEIEALQIALDHALTRWPEIAR